MQGLEQKLINHLIIEAGNKRKRNRSFTLLSSCLLSPTWPAPSRDSSSRSPDQAEHPSGRPSCWAACGASFLFLYFSKTFFTEIYFQFHNLQFYTPTARQGGGRGPAAQQWGGRDLYINLKKIICAEALGGSLPPPWRAAGSRQRLPRKYFFLKFTYKSLPPRCWAAGPLPPPCRAVGVQN